MFFVVVETIILCFTLCLNTYKKLMQYMFLNYIKFKTIIIIIELLHNLGNTI